MSYPAGVTGNEYAISGPTFEDAAHMYCETCEGETEGVVQGHPERGVWFVCDECENTTDLPREDEEYSSAHESADEARAEQRAEREHSPENGC